MALSKTTRGLAAAAFAGLASLGFGASAQAGEAQAAPVSSLDDWQQTRTLEEAREASMGKAIFYYDPSTVKSVEASMANLQNQGFDVSSMNGPAIIPNIVLLFINGKGPAHFNQDDVYEGELGYQTSRIYSALLGKPDKTDVEIVASID